MSAPSTELWTVRYRRRGWNYEQSRDFRREYAARRLAKKLTGDSWQWDHLEPLEYVRLERQTLGAPELVKEYR